MKDVDEEEIESDNDFDDYIEDSEIIQVTPVKSTKRPLTPKQNHSSMSKKKNQRLRKDCF